MNSYFFLFLIFYLPLVVSEQFDYISSTWWAFSGTLVARYIVSSWNIWRRSSRKITSENNLEGLTALLRIRSAEVGAIYYNVRSYQKKVKENAWVPLFMAQYRTIQNSSLYDDFCKKINVKYLAKAKALYSRRFYRNPVFGTFEESELMETASAIQSWSFDFGLSIRLLCSIQCDASLSRHVCALLYEYRLIQILTLGGNYHILFKGLWPLSHLARESYCRLRQHWEEVVRSHQGAIIISKASNISSKETLLLDDLWTENESLGDMERNLRRALSQENSSSFGWEGDLKREASFFQRLKGNPIWTKFHNYDPYASESQ